MTTTTEFEDIEARFLSRGDRIELDIGGTIADIVGIETTWFRGEPTRVKISTSRPGYHLTRVLYELAGDRLVRRVKRAKTVRNLFPEAKTEPTTVLYDNVYYRAKVVPDSKRSGQWAYEVWTRPNVTDTDFIFRSTDGRNFGCAEKAEIAAKGHLAELQKKADIENAGYFV